MRRLPAFALLLTALVGTALPAGAQTTAQGKTLYQSTLDCDRAGCHQGGSASNNVNKIQNAVSYTAILDARQNVGDMSVLPQISDFQAQAIACYIQSWFGTPSGPTCAGTSSAAPPSCTVSASDPAPVPGNSITLTASCTNSPTGYSWTNCTGTGRTCVTTMGTAGPRTYSVTASNAAGTSPPATVTVTWGTAANYTGLWWNAPDGSESGWGLNLVHGGNTIFGTWFTYDDKGKGWWVTMILAEGNAGVFSGSVFETRGPAFSSVPFNSASVSVQTVGTATVDFTAAGGPRFSYALKGQSQSKTLKRQPLGSAPFPACTYSASANPATATNYTDIWYAAPAGSESGWGVNLTQQGDTIFLAWFTYETSGSPLWLVATLNRTGGQSFAGDLYRTTASPFYAFNPASVAATKVGSATLAFGHGNSATFGYSVDGIAQTKSITRQQLVAGYTVCQ